MRGDDHQKLPTRKTPSPKIKPLIVKELKFDSVPENVLQMLNDRKLTLMDFVMMKMEMVLEGKELFVLASEEVLGS